MAFCRNRFGFVVMSALYAFGLFGIVAASISLAYAQEVYFYEPAPHDLISFVSAHTGVNLPDDLRIGVIDNASPILVYEPDWGHGISVAAQGLVIAGQIYLPIRSIVHMQEDKYRALVVHELTHVAQDLSKRSFACTDQREAEAYGLQNLFLSLHGLPPVIDAAMLIFLRNCNEAMKGDNKYE